MLDKLKQAWKKFIKRYIVDMCPKELNDLF
jgi:hypothetical protein